MKLFVYIFFFCVLGEAVYGSSRASSGRITIKPYDLNITNKKNAGSKAPEQDFVPEKKNENTSKNKNPFLGKKPTVEPLDRLKSVTKLQSSEKTSVPNNNKGMIPQVSSPKGLNLLPKPSAPEKTISLENFLDMTSLDKAVLDKVVSDKAVKSRLEEQFSFLRKQNESDINTIKNSKYASKDINEFVEQCKNKKEFRDVPDELLRGLITAYANQDKVGWWFGVEKKSEFTDFMTWIDQQKTVSWIDSLSDAQKKYIAIRDIKLVRNEFVDVEYVEKIRTIHNPVRKNILREIINNPRSSATINTMLESKFSSLDARENTKFYDRQIHNEFLELTQDIVDIIGSITDGVVQDHVTKLITFNAKNIQTSFEKEVVLAAIEKHKQFNQRLQIMQIKNLVSTFEAAMPLTADFNNIINRYVQEYEQPFKDLAQSKNLAADIVYYNQVQPVVMFMKKSMQSLIQKDGEVLQNQTETFIQSKFSFKQGEINKIPLALRFEILQNAMESLGLPKQDNIFQENGFDAGVKALHKLVVSHQLTFFDSIAETLSFVDAGIEQKQKTKNRAATFPFENSQLIYNYDRLLDVYLKQFHELQVRAEEQAEKIQKTVSFNVDQQGIVKQTINSKTFEKICDELAQALKAENSNLRQKTNQNLNSEIEQLKKLKDVTEIKENLLELAVSYSKQSQIFELYEQIVEILGDDITHEFKQVTYRAKVEEYLQNLINSKGAENSYRKLKNIQTLITTSLNKLETMNPDKIAFEGKNDLDHLLLLEKGTLEDYKSFYKAVLLKLQEKQTNVWNETSTAQLLDNTRQIYNSLNSFNMVGLMTGAHPEQVNWSAVLSTTADTAWHATGSAGELAGAVQDHITQALGPIWDRWDPEVKKIFLRTIYTPLIISMAGILASALASDQKKEKLQQVWQAGVKDTVAFVIANETGADLEIVADSLSSGDLSDIAISGVGNKMIDQLQAQDTEFKHSNLERSSASPLDVIITENKKYLYKDAVGESSKINSIISQAEDRFNRTIAVKLKSLLAQYGNDLEGLKKAYVHVYNLTNLIEQEKIALLDNLEGSIEQLGGFVPKVPSSQTSERSNQVERDEERLLKKIDISSSEKTFLNDSQSEKVDKNLSANSVKDLSAFSEPKDFFKTSEQSNGKQYEKTTSKRLDIFSDKAPILKKQESVNINLPSSIKSVDKDPFAELSLPKSSAKKLSFEIPKESVETNKLLPVNPILRLKS